jgi:hypothetical protein
MERVRKSSVIQQETAIKESRKKLTQSKHRRNEINGLIKKLYESYAAGKIPEKHFTELLTGYDTEQSGLDTEIAELQKAINSYNTDSVKADMFIELVKRHTEFNELTAVLLNEFVEKVLVYEAEKKDGIRTQRIEIFLNFIGKFQLPEWGEIINEQPKPKGVKKLRRDMTAEELQIERERDKRHYAKKTAAKRAAEQAERAAILQGTSFETTITEKKDKQAAS